MLTLAQIAHDLGAAPTTIKIWQRLGLITGRRINGRREYHYHPGQRCPPGNACRDTALRRQKKLSDPTATINPTRSSRRHKARGLTHPRQKVQYEAHALDRPCSMAARIDAL